MKKIIYFLLIAVAPIVSCKKDRDSVEITPDFLKSLDLRFEAKYNPGLDEDVVCDFDGNVISAVIPQLDPDKSGLVLSFNSKLVSVEVNKTDQVSGTSKNDFSNPVNYRLRFSNGDHDDYIFKVKEFTGLPIFHLSTEANAPIVSKSTYVNGNLTINANHEYEQAVTHYPMEIRGRGNSTWGMPKKPYRIRLKEKGNILGVHEARNWVLLANYSDKSLLRTAVVFDLGRAIHADFTPEYRHVEVFLNNRYIGTYMLTEQVQVNDDRVEIDELKPSDTGLDKITGGYLLELDKRRDEDFIVETSLRKLPFAVKSPDDITPEQYNYIEAYLNKTEEAIYAENFDDPVEGYAKYINVESFINWFLVQELVKNQDAKDYSSIYYYKPRNEKLGMGPLWDFDLSAGNVNYSIAQNPLGWWVRHGPWFIRLFRDPVFVDKVRKRWDEIRHNEIEDMLKNIDVQAHNLRYAQRQNFNEWKILDQQVWPNPAIYYTHEGEVNQIKDWLNKRIAWLDANL